MVGEGRELEKDGGLEQSLKVRGLGADYGKVRGRMSGAGGSRHWHACLGNVARTR